MTLFLSLENSVTTEAGFIIFHGRDDNCFHSEPVEFEVSVEQRDADVRQDPEPRMRVMGD